MRSKLWSAAPTGITLQHVFSQEARSTNQVIREACSVLYFWLWSKISCFDLLIWSQQAHGWRSCYDTRKAHALCLKFTKVCCTTHCTERNCTIALLQRCLSAFELHFAPRWLLNSCVFARVHMHCLCMSKYVQPLFISMDLHNDACCSDPVVVAVGVFSPDSSLMITWWY